ncbi:MAG: insulinase family protein, partial [Pseudomonadota bacterium]
MNRWVWILIISLTTVACAVSSKTSSSASVSPKTNAAKASPATEMDPWKNKKNLIYPPALKPIGALTLTSLKRFQLKNGLSVLLLPERDFPLVSVHLLIGIGSIDDPVEKSGLAEYTLQMLRQGTKKQTADQISEHVDSAGCSLEIHTGYEISSISCTGRSKNLGLCLKMVADLIIQPS